MPATLNPIIYRTQKNFAFRNYDFGKIVSAISEDLKEFGQQGVQGLPVKKDEADRMIKYHSQNKSLREPHLMAGVVGKDLVLVIRDAKESKFEAMAVLVKDYVGIKADLAKNSAAVVNLAKGDKTIDPAAAAQADKFKTAVQDKSDADFGTVTGNVVLCAHGTPETAPGRVIGVKLGKMTAKEIADLLTKNPDKSKRLAREYAGKITLSGCFTASGGPEALKQDDPFAKKVWDELKARGFTRCSVVGMPGVAMTARGARTDDEGTAMKRGDKGVWAKSEEMLEAQAKKAAQIRKELDALVDALVKAGKNYKGDKSIFLGSDVAKKSLAKINEKEQALDTIRKEMESIKKDAEKYGDVDGKLMAHVTGTFGLRVVQRELAT